MKYVATVEYADGSKSMSFKKLNDAENWLDSENNNLEYGDAVPQYKGKIPKKNGYDFI